MKKQTGISTKHIERKLYALILALGAIFLAVIGIVLFTKFPLSTPPQQTTDATVTTASKATYVDNKLCLQCHQSQAKEWMTSHHAWAMAHANAMTVKGNFDNVPFQHHGVTSQFFKRDNKFYVRTEGPDGKTADFEIKYTFGVSPLQQYLIELPGGRLQNFTIAWDVAHKQWFHLYPNEITPPDDVLHWAGRYQNANMMCMNCHTTNFQKNYDAKTDTYATTFSEMNVSCQSCHGPGEHHIRWAQAKTQGKTLPDMTGEHDGLLVDFKKGGTNSVIETCAMCHSRRGELTPNAMAGQPLMDNFLPTLLNEDLYYPDGQQHAEVYVYNSFRQSKMYQMGVSCIDCHNPHTGKLKAEGNAVCTQCHSPQGDTRFPSAAKLYDDPSHHHHKMGTPGAQCVSCHMPAKNYMIIHSRPDHNIRIPRPDLSVKLGTPNACTNCHTDKSAQWAADAIAKWYPGHQAQLHYGEIIAAGRAGKMEAEDALIKLAEDESKPNIVRATALDLLSHYGPNSIAVSIKATKSADPTLRRAAISSLEKLNSSERLDNIAPLLSDPILAVRIEAARILSNVAPELFTQTQLKLYKNAITEYEKSQQVSLDMPTSNLNLAVLSENRHQPILAEEYYLKALHIDPDFAPARLNLARLYNSIHRNADAEHILKEGIKRIPQQGELYYSLGLLLAEDNHTSEAAEALEKAAQYLPGQARVRYNYALLLQQLGQRKKAEQALLTAERLAPSDAAIIYALAVFYVQDKQWLAALNFAKKLEVLHPDDAQAHQFTQQIQGKLAE